MENRTTMVRDHFFVVTTLQDGEWLFCLVVPVITGFLIFRDRRELFVGRGASGLHGFLLLLLGCTLYWIGYWQDDRNFGFLALQVLLAGLVVWFCGWPVMRAGFFPWIFFGFTWPFLPLEQLLALPLRNVTAAFSHTTLDFIGLDAVRHGTSVLSAAEPGAGLAEGARFHLDVAQPCSGIRSLFSLMMVSAFYGHLGLQDALRRLLLFAASIPLAMLGNSVRILMLAAGSVVGGTEFAVGKTGDPSPFHTASGFVVFAVALGGMIGLARLLEDLRFPRFRKSFPPRSITRPAPPAAWRASIPILLAALALVACQRSKNLVPELSSPGLGAELPRSAGRFTGVPMEVTSGETRQLIAIGCSVSRNKYTDPERPYLPPMLATVVVSGSEERSLHEPEVCLPAQGWRQGNRETLSFAVGNDGSTRTATLMALQRDVVDKGGTTYRVYAYNLFWYEGYDVATPSYQHHIILTQRDKLLRQLTHRWSLASLFTASPPQVQPAADPAEMLAALRAELVQFAETITPHMIVKPHG